jgi:hypothetical protein
MSTASPHTRAALMILYSAIGRREAQTPRDPEGSRRRSLAMPFTL